MAEVWVSCQAFVKVTVDDSKFLIKYSIFTTKAKQKKKYRETRNQ